MRKLIAFFALFFFLCTNVKAQKKLTGKVTDENGKAVPNASVTIKGSRAGTFTNADGIYSLDVPVGAKYLVISSVDMSSQEISIGSLSQINVKLHTAKTDLQEVVMVAYGTAKKSTYTGALSVLKTDDIEKQQISNITKGFEGMVPGVVVTTGSGQPGASTSIRIRGIGSINASSEPLIVVDGFPYGGDINSINANDVESISFLKDAAAAALYGARGGNGVILVTTKKGNGKPKIELQSRIGYNDRAIPDYDVIKDPGQFLETYWLSLRNQFMLGASQSQAGLMASDSLFSQAYLNNYNPYSVPSGQRVIDPVTGKLNPNAKLLYYDDWNDAMFDKQVRQEYMASVSGSSEKTQYYFSTGYLNDKGYIVKSDFTRLSTKLRLDQTINNWFKAGLNLAYSKTKTNNTEEGGSYQNAFSYTRYLPPIYPVWVRDATGNIILDSKGNKKYDYGNGVENGSMGIRRYGPINENPRATLDMDDNTYNGNNVSSRAYAEITPLKGLAIKLNYGIDLLDSKEFLYTNLLAGGGVESGGFGNYETHRNLTEDANELINYKHSFGKHNFELLAGHESYKFTTEFFSADKQGYLFPGDPELSGAYKVTDAQSRKQIYTVEGYLSQLRYDYKNKYFVSGSIRRDGSSRFAAGHQWGTFWSTGFGWNISSEKFMERFHFLDVLKLKFSVGESGNDNLNYVGSAGLSGSNYYPYTNQYTIKTTDSTANLTQVYIGNENITWERNKDINWGIEFGILKRITGSIEFFKRTTSDMLLSVPPAFSTGILGIPANAGTMYNKGFEAAIGVDVIKTKDLRWNISANATHWVNKITELPTNIEENNHKYSAGHSIYEFYTWAYAGVDETNGKSLWYKDELDVNGKATGKRLITSEYSEANKYYTGKSSIPDVSGGVSTEVSYKNFDFSVITSYGIGGWVYDHPYQSLMSNSGGEVSTWHKDILSAWTYGNSGNTSVPKIENSYQGAGETSDRWLTKGDYFNLRNIVLGYTFNKSILTKANITNARIYVSADNVWFSSRRQGLDPRRSFDGNIGEGGYSPIRTISAGLNVTF